MKKLYLIMLLISSCGYNPVIDTAGKSGSFDESRADQITNDLQHCKTLAKENTNDVLEGFKVVHNWYIRPSLLFLPDKAEYSYKPMVNKCMTLRGHAVLTGE
jgi:hypothetical protein